MRFETKMKIRVASPDSVPIHLNHPISLRGSVFSSHEPKAAGELIV